MFNRKINKIYNAVFSIFGGDLVSSAHKQIDNIQKSLSPTVPEYSRMMKTSNRTYSLVDNIYLYLSSIRKRFEDVDKHIKVMEGITECSTCGCLIWKDRAFQGESIIEQNLIRTSFGLIRGYSPRESLKEQFYCKVHIPKIKRKR